MVAISVSLPVGDHRVNAHDGVLGVDIVVVEFDRAVFMQDCLEAVHGRGPRHVLNAANRLGQAPGDDRAVAWISFR